MRRTGSHGCGEVSTIVRGDDRPFVKLSITGREDTRPRIGLVDMLMSSSIRKRTPTPTRGCSQGVAIEQRTTRSKEWDDKVQAIPQYRCSLRV